MLNNAIRQNIQKREADLQKKEIAVKMAMQELEMQKAELSKAKSDFEKEMEFKTTSAFSGDVIELNIGGQQHVTTTRATLTQVEGSFLAAMFSGRWEGKLAVDKEGAYVIDADPALVLPIINWLRRVSMPRAPGEPFPALECPEELPAGLKRSDFHQLVSYWRLLPSALPDSFSQTRHGPLVQISQKNMCVTHIPGDQHCFAFGATVYSGSDLKRWKLHLNDDRWIFVGVIDANCVPQDEHTYADSSCFGWAGHHRKFTAGSSEDFDSSITLQANVEMELNCSDQTLTLFASGQEFTQHVPAGSWKLHANLYFGGTSITILE